MSSSDEGRMHFATGIDNSQMQSDAAQSREILHRIGRTAVQEGQNIDNTMKNIGKTIAAVFSVQQLSSFTSAVVKARSEIQSLEVSFTTLLGNEPKAKQLFGELRDFAVKTPMQLNDLAKGAQTLLSFNYAADKIMPTLRALGDISMGDAQKFQSLTLAFAQIQSTGKLMGQDLLQLINAGFNPLSVISEKTGKSIGVLKEEMSKGAISAKMVEDAFISATSEGGKFHGMLESQSKSLTGSLSNLEGAWNDMLNDIGTRTEGVMADAISLATTCVQHYDTFVKVLMSLAAAYGTYKAALMAVVVVEQARNLADNIRLVMMFRKELGLLTAAQQAFNITAMKNPYILLAAAIVGVITALVAFGKQEDETQKRIDKANDKIKEQQAELEHLAEKKDAVTEAEKSAAQSTADEINKIEILSNTIHDNTASIDDRRRAITQLQGLVPEYHATLNDEGQLHHDNTTAIEEHIKSLNRLAMARALQNKREEFVSQKVNAEIDRRTAKQNEEKASENVTAANEQVRREQEAYKGRMQETDNATIESDNWFVRGVFASQEGQISRAGTSEAYRTALDAAKKNAQAAEAELQVAQGQVAIADQRIQNANEQLSVLDDMLKDYQDVDVTGNNSTTTTTTNPKDKKKQPMDSTLSQMEYEASVKAQVRQSAFDLEQERINGMNEGVQKYLDQVKLNYDRMKFANEQREEEMVSELRKQRQQEWEYANPNATEQERMSHKLELQTTITAADLAPKQRDIIKEYARIAEEYRQEANRKSIEKMLSDVLTYEQQRDKITEEYARRREDMYVTDSEGNKSLRKGVTQGNINELNRQEQDALTSVDEQFAQREASYQAWCDSIANITLEQLKQVLAQAEEELAKLKKTEGVDSKQLAVARAKVANVRDKVDKKNTKNNLSPDKRSIEDWNELRKALEDCCNTFDEIGDAIGGVAGEIISTTGNIMSSTLSMINGIVQLVTMSSNAMTGTSTAASKAIQTVEKASVILAVISAAMQIAMQIINLFNSDKQKQEEIEALQGRIDELQWELDHVDIMNLRKNSIDSLKMVRNTTAEVTVALLRQRKAVGDTAGIWRLLYGEIIKDNDALTLAVNNLAQAYTNVKYTADKALGENKYKQAEEDLKKLTEQQIIIQEQIRAEEEKKKTDDGAIADMQKKIEELGAEAVSIINDIVEDIIGGSSTDIANELADAFFEAFEAGEDAAEAWGEKVNDIIGDILKRLMVQKFLEEPLGEVFNKYKSKWFKDGKFSGIDTVINSLTDFANDLKDKGNDFADIWGALPEEIKDIIGGTADREASKEGIATASQESVDELNGRATAIQGHTYSINEQTKNLVSIASATLESILNIEQYTERIADRVDRVERNVWDIKSSIDEISIKGIKIQ